MGRNSITIHADDELFGGEGHISDAFYAQIRGILEDARARSYSAVNSAMVHAYWEIGRSIVEQQGGEDRAEYGKRLIKGLSERLTRDYGKGFTPTNLRYMRQFYLLFPNCHALRDELSWTHYRMLLKVEDGAARAFYLEECAEAGWSTRQLERQINSFYYQRLLKSRDKDGVREEITRLEPARQPRDFIRDPYVLEFLDIEPSPDLYESDLENALIGRLQGFLLELGRGFSFVARQKHVDLDGEHFRIDLVFYNFILKRFVLIDLKTTKLTHQDIGQMALAQPSVTKQMRPLWERYDSGTYVWTIEHVFPQGENIPQSWVDMVGDGDRAKAQEIQAVCVHKLGNLTLTGYNSKLGTMPFAEKRDRRERSGAYVGYRSGLNLNDDLVDAEAWTQEQIEARTAKLVKLALDAFSFDGLGF